jgi:uncharacterized membrane protein YgcG
MDSVYRAGGFDMAFRILVGALVALACGGTTVSAAIKISDTAMDRITAGDEILTPPLAVACPSCTVTYSNSMSTNGVTVSMSGSQIPGSGGGGSSSGSGGSGSGSGTSLLVSTTVAVPPALAATLAQAATPTQVSP